MGTQKEVYQQTFNEDDSPGLAAISAREKEIYGDQEPLHLATVIPFELGGEDPLWAVDIFISDNQQKHFHSISLGFTNLFFDEDYSEDEINGFGIELTFRHVPMADESEQPVWTASLLQNLAKYVFKTQKVFDDYHYISANGPLRNGIESDITAIVFYTDPELGELETPHGYFKFLQLFGITTSEYNDLKEKKYKAKDLIDRHILTNPLLITDLTRK